MLEGAVLCEQSLCIIQLTIVFVCGHINTVEETANAVPLNDINAYEVEV